MTDENKKLIVDLIEDTAVQKLDRDKKNRAIRDLFEQGFIANEPDGPRQIHSKMLIQADNQFASIQKFLDFELKAQNRTIPKKMVTTAGFATIADKGGLDEIMRDKGGVFQNLRLYGDGYFTVNVNDNEKEKTKVPIVFDTYTNSNVVLDNNATKMRGRGGKAVDKALVYSMFNIDEAKRIFGEEEIGDAHGKIPRNNNELEALDKDPSQHEKLTKKVEVGYFWCLSQKQYVVFAGSKMKELERKEGDDYPFMLNGVPYIPVFDFMCIPSAKGIYNHGIGDYIYELAIVSQRLLNLGIGHAYKNTDPLTILNLPEGQTDVFLEKIDDANRMRAQGREAYVPVEYNKLSPGASAVQSQGIVTQALVNEWQIIFDRLVLELKRIGINIDAVEGSSPKVQVQIIQEEQDRSAFAKQVMEWNASETQFLLEVVLELMKDNISVSNKTPINTTIKVDDEEAGPVEFEDITYGDIASELKKYEYYVSVDSRTGVIPSNIVKQAKTARVLQTLPPGSAAYMRTLREFAALNDHNFTLEDFGIPQQQAGQGEVPQDVEVASTDREELTAR